ncbi:DUF421 domain-containing protein [Clostridium bovifaecis]|uniref:DUF421 domain-containing protein n=1 Tax=Clostridium bovifaecis TaxID=2184719 RepID=A0A6I6ETU5_9CLOT|nr:DUF421 domain-containing protein [Clostridium bovifaecis]
MGFVWRSLILISVGTILLRISGRKSISQMTVAQTVIMISIGSLIVQPIVEKSIWKTIVAASIFIAFLVLTEYLQVKFNFIEKLITGKSKVVIQDGNIVVDNLKKLRFTIDQLEIRLRQAGISNISDVKMATLEANGQLGYELMRHVKPLTIGEFEKMMQSFNVGMVIKNSSAISKGCYHKSIPCSQNLIVFMRMNSFLPTYKEPLLYIF